MWRRLWATAEAVYVDPKNTLSIQGLLQHIGGIDVPVRADSGLNGGLTTDWRHPFGLTTSLSFGFFISAVVVALPAYR